MKRVMVIGCGGAGKSTFSKQLHSITNLEVFHLDHYYWQPNWVESKTGEWENQVIEIAKKDNWIIDGNYGSTMDLRLQRADTIIYLDFSTIKCLWRVTKRIFKYYGKVRPEMAEGCKERFDLEFYHYIATFNLTRRKKLLDKLEKHKVNKSIYIFSNDLETEAFLNKIRNQQISIK